MFQNQGSKFSSRYLILFTVLRLSNDEGIKDKSIMNSLQLKYEQLILRALQSTEQYGITSLAIPVLEPNGEFDKSNLNFVLNNKIKTFSRSEISC